MEAVWWKHRKAEKAHGFHQFGGVGMRPWIVSLCRQVRFARGSLEHQAHEVFTDDMNDSPENFCGACIKKFSEVEAMPKTKMKWPSVTCPKCGEQAWMTDSVYIIVCDHCEMNYAIQQPLYDKEPKVQDDDQPTGGTERPRPTLVKGVGEGASREEIQNDSAGSGRADGVESASAPGDDAEPSNGKPTDATTRH